MSAGGTCRAATKYTLTGVLLILSGCCPLKPSKHGKSQLGIAGLNERAGHAVATPHVFRFAVDHIAEQPTAIVKLDQRHDIGLLAFPFRLNRPAHDGKCLDD